MGGCASVKPWMDYSSDLSVPEAPIAVDVVVEATDEVKAAMGEGALESFRDALRADLDANGPFRIDQNSPNGILRVRLTRLEVDEPGGAGYLLWILYILPLVGVPYERTDVVINAKATLEDANGNVIVDVLAEADDSTYSGAYYNHTVTYEGAAEDLAEQIREGLADKREKAVAALQGGTAVAKGPDKDSGDEPSAGEPSEEPAAGGLVTGSPQPTAYALVVGIERYRDAPAATGARQDAERFADVVRKTLNVPSDHIRVALDDRATRVDLEKHLDWLRTNARDGSRVYFYFSGHGAPEASSGTPYLLPYDGDPEHVERTGLAMQTLLAELGKSKAKETLAFVDACFSGAGGRSVLPKGARPLVRVQKQEVRQNVALFSSSSGAEISGPVPGGEGGLFSHYVAEGLGTGAADADGDGQISLEELSEWVGPRVKRRAKEANRKQTPHLKMGSGLDEAENIIVAWGLPAQ